MHQINRLKTQIQNGLYPFYRISPRMKRSSTASTQHDCQDPALYIGTVKCGTTVRRAAFTDRPTSLSF